MHADALPRTTYISQDLSRPKGSWISNWMTIECPFPSLLVSPATEDDKREITIISVGPSSSFNKLCTRYAFCIPNIFITHRVSLSLWSIHEQVHIRRVESSEVSEASACTWGGVVQYIYFGIGNSLISYSPNTLLQTFIWAKLFYCSRRTATGRRA